MKHFLNIFFFYALISLVGCKHTNVDLPNAALYVTTTDKAKLLEEQPVIATQKIENIHTTITLNTSQMYQKMDGFGFTLTGGSAMLINKMSETPRKELLKELFGTGKNDIGISYLRVSIGGSDLDERPWSYNDLPDGETDTVIEKFSLAYDTLHLIPVLKQILKIAPDLKIMGSPWSPPHWMKDNNDTRGGSLKKEYYDTYAQYFVKYINSMRENGITIDAVTVQNEPLHPGNNPSLLMLADQQAEFIKNHLGPAFENNNLTTKIIIYDHNADRPDYPISILNDPLAAKYIDGSAFHLYNGEIEALSEVHEAHPNKNLYFTEQWIGAPGNFAGDFTWHIENLIIGASRNWCKTVLEWNLAADENQEPHTDRGGCVGCLGAVTITGDNVIRNPAYYVIAQASKFVRPGAVRVATNTDGNILNVAFKTTEGTIVVILQNKNEDDKNISIKMEDKSVHIELEAKAVATLVF